MLTAALEMLEEEHASYFHDVAERLEEDPRTERAPNLIFLVLSDTVRFLPTYLDKREIIERLHRFVDANYRRLNMILYDPAFLENRGLITQVTGDFVAEVIEATLVRHDEGVIDTGEPEAHRFVFDAEGGTADFPYIDDDDLED